MGRLLREIKPDAVEPLLQLFAHGEPIDFETVLKNGGAKGLETMEQARHMGQLDAALQDHLGREVITETVRKVAARVLKKIPVISKATRERLLNEITRTEFYAQESSANGTHSVIDLSVHTGCPKKSAPCLVDICTEPKYRKITGFEEENRILENASSGAKDIGTEKNSEATKDPGVGSDTTTNRKIDPGEPQSTGKADSSTNDLSDKRGEPVETESQEPSEVSSEDPLHSIYKFLRWFFLLGWLWYIMDMDRLFVVRIRDVA